MPMSELDPSRITPMTAAQRASLARLRVRHPRADVTVGHPYHQPDLPYVRIKMRWARTSIVRWFWLAPDGSRLARQHGNAGKPR
jgi:hypothetical protein